MNVLERALPDATRERTMQQMCHRPLADHSTMILVRKIALLQGNAQDALLLSQKASEPSMSSMHCGGHGR